MVRPLRFAGDTRAMRSYLEVIGMQPRMESDSGGWVDMVAGAGMVALHSAETSDTGGQPGETRLSFETADLALVADRLRAAGYEDATIWDESYGRVLSVTDPLGDQLWIDGYDGDSYGFRVHEPKRDLRLSVMPVKFAEPSRPVGAFLEALGLAPRQQGASEHWRVWGGHTGLVALHTPPVDHALLGGRAAVQLTFETAEPLEQVADRLRRGGHDAKVNQEVFGAALYVQDPDGQEVVVHHSAETS